MKAGRTGDTLRISMLGPFECRRGDDGVPREAWRTRPTLSLFKLLLDERDRAVPVDRLIDAIWPDREPAAARQSLQVAVRTIRLALEPGLRRGADSRYVHTEMQAYRFDSTHAVIDVDLFLAASQRATGERRRDTSTTVAACNEAIALYRGEYLADDPYGEWAFSVRERLRSRYLDVLDVLSDSHSIAGRWEESIGWIERALDLDPLREELYRRLMRCHVAQGRRSHALVAFERCRSVLQQELGVAPSAETLELHDELSKRQPSSAVKPGAVPSAAKGATDLRLPFVGRSREVAELENAFSRARSEAGVLAAVSGPPGIGKSQLVEELGRHLESRPSEHSGAAFRLVWLHCHEAERNVPFAPLIRLIAGWLEQSSGVAVRQRLAPFGAALARIVPQVQALTGVDLQAQGAFELSQILEASTQAVKLMYRDESGLLAVDDLQWADASTILWLSYVLHRLDGGILTLVTYRTAESATPEMNHLLSDALRNGRLIDVPLQPLEVGALGELVAAGLRDADQRAGLSRYLHRESGGIPLYVVEMLRDLAASGRIYVDSEGWWRTARLEDSDWTGAGPPEGALREIILSRVNRLDPATLDVFRAMCVAGAECRARLISLATGAPLETTLSALDDLLEHELIQTSAGGRGYVVAHPVVREVVYESLSAARRQEWHLRIAGALRNMAPESPALPGQALHHLIAGDAPVLEIIEAANGAGEQATHRSAVSDAIRFFSLALDHLRTLLPDPDARLRYAATRERLADALVAAGRWDEAIETYEDLFETGQDRLGRARALRKLAGVLGDVRGQFERAREVLVRAEQELDSLGAMHDREALNIERGRIEAARTTAYFFQSDYRRAIEHGERALGYWAGQAGFERDEIEQLVRLGNAEQRLGRLEDAGKRYRAATARAEMLGDRVLESRCRDMLGGLLSVQGRLREAQDIHEQTTEVGWELGIPRLELGGLTNTAVALFQLGKFQAAKAAYELALERSEALDAQYTIMHVLVGLGEVLVRLGESDRARDVLERGIELAEAINSTQRRGHAYLHLAELALLEGEFACALEWAERGILTGAEIDDIHARREGLPIYAQTLIELGRLEEAIDAARQGLRTAEAGGFRLSQARNLMALGEALAASGRLPEATTVVADAERITREIDARYDLARTLILQARWGATGQRRRAQLEEARELARAAPSRWLVESINELERT